MTPSATLVLVHGWGFDASLWDGFKEAWPDCPMVTIDLGFRGVPNFEPSLPEGPLIGVGHSLGFLWLLKTKPFAWQKLVAINSFSRFAATDDFPVGIPEHVLSLMIENIQKEPVTVAFKKLFH